MTIDSLKIYKNNGSSISGFEKPYCVILDIFEPYYFNSEFLLTRNSSSSNAGKAK